MKPDSNGQQIYTPQQIAQWISRYRASGLGLPRFAQELGIPSGRLHYWLYQKRRGRSTSRHGQPPKLSGLPPAPLFQEVKLAACLPPGNPWAAEVSLSRGLTVRFSAAATPGWMGSVVQALQRPC